MKHFCYTLLFLFCNIPLLTAQYTPKDFSKLLQEKKYKELSAFIQGALATGKYRPLIDIMVNQPLDEQLTLFDSLNIYLEAFNSLALFGDDDDTTTTTKNVAAFSKILTAVQAKKKSLKQWDRWAAVSMAIISNAYFGDYFDVIEQNYTDLVSNLEKIDTNRQVGILITGGIIISVLLITLKKLKSFFIK